MRERVRTFIAIDVDNYVRERALHLMDILRTANADVKWVEPENLHITIKFLGEVLSRDIYHICQAVQKAVANIEPFPLIVQGAGAFPDLIRPRHDLAGFFRGSGAIGQPPSVCGERPVAAGISARGAALQGPSNIGAGAAIKSWPGPLGSASAGSDRILWCRNLRGGSDRLFQSVDAGRPHL